MKSQQGTPTQYGSNPNHLGNVGKTLEDMKAPYESFLNRPEEPIQPTQPIGTGPVVVPRTSLKFPSFDTSKQASPISRINVQQPAPPK
jgi:hypothetical protein